TACETPQGSGKDPSYNNTKFTAWFGISLANLKFGVHLDGPKGVLVGRAKLGIGELMDGVPTVKLLTVFGKMKLVKKEIAKMKVHPLAFLMTHLQVRKLSRSTSLRMIPLFCCSCTLNRIDEKATFLAVLLTNPASTSLTVLKGSFLRILDEKNKVVYLNRFN